ncbi:MAG: glycoside hydrolase family 3 N-terminal domain-containing protein [Oscillospiraceae bacterium]|nr:glycoside hydrolase family 3 N-terminal domain-containing protein [Oscillospiraceae bacterium]
MQLFDYEKNHVETLRKGLAECTVLLKHDGAFPLEKAGKIAAYGNGVRRTIKGGTGSGEVNSRYFVNVEQGLKNAGFQITTDKWLNAYEEQYAIAKKNFINVLKAEAKALKMNYAIYGMGKPMPEFDYDLPLDAEGDAAVYVVARISGEGNDRSPKPGDVKLSKTEVRDILELNKRFDKFMLVINAGGVIDLSDVMEVRNILVLSQLGVETGDALADILLGKANPSGKLTTTWSAWEDYCTEGTFGDMNDTYYKEGIYVGYRYFDTVGKKALFPFGFGKSFTTFSLNNEKAALTGSKVTVTVDVTNTGSYDGKEVAQVYVSQPQGKLDKAYQELAGFAKTGELKAGEKETLEISFDMKDLASYDEERSAYILEPGKYLVRVGNSSDNTKVAAAVELDREVIVTQAKKCLGDPGFKDYRPDAVQNGVLPGGTPILTLDAGSISTETVIYDHEYEIDPAVEKFSDDQLILMNIGAFNPKGGIGSVIGNASSSVAGAAGETTSALENLGYRHIVVADGPAGVRITPMYYRDEKGAHGIGQGGIPESILELMPGIVRWFMSKLAGTGKAPKGVEVKYQYCTAIPIGTALAQSWNLDLAEECGKIVGDEMERFGVDLWLAPALNIHRSILCGRNFEYFSEDPLISGKMAAAITNGVQSYPGRGTTIKHYAANNQELNRYGNNSRVSERAMREIYLKGFGICVKESQPLALMTSYNLLNGKHTAESVDLCENILRREYGYKGIVMTDWVVGGGVMNSKTDIHPRVKPRLEAAAGGDLFMPGCKADFDDMKAGLAEGSLTRKQLMINATRLYRLSKDMYSKR